jgi:hypothetical protein
MRLSDMQRNALLMAYSDDHVLRECPDAEWGSSPRTIRSLVQRGLIVAADGPSGLEYDITEAGKDALGARWPGGKVPKYFRTAFRKAAAALGVSLDDVDLYRPCEAPPMWSLDEVQYDFSGALLVVVGAYVHLEEAAWSAIGKMLSDAGFPCHADVSCYLVDFWPKE